MAENVKVLKKFCAQIQSGSTYESDAMFMVPLVSETLNQNYDPIEDDSIVGVGFKGIPKQGSRHTSGAVTQNLDSIGCEQILEAAFGTESSGVYTLGSNSKKMSCCLYNGVNAVEYANVYVKRIRFSGAPNGLWQMDYDIIGVTAQDRDVIGNFPSVTDPGDPLSFHEAGGTGYFRVGDDGDALAGGDEINIESFELEITCGFDEQYCNEGVSTLTPIFGMVQPEVTGSFVIARHDADTFQDFEDNHTALQAELYIYGSATDNIKIQIPRFPIKCEVTDDDVAKQNIEMLIGRNGIGSTYQNSNMSFTSPVRVTVVNS